MSDPTAANADTLLRLFYSDPSALGSLTAADSESLPFGYRELLFHERHMTVTVEKFYDSLVDVKVLAVRTSDEYYSRKIVLTRQSDAKAVQFGIVRLNRSRMPPEALAEIEAQKKPLGRVLIELDVLRKVKLVGLWHVDPSLELQTIFGSPAQTYGRSALIHVNDEPVIELLEIVAPLPTSTDS